MNNESKKTLRVKTSVKAGSNVAGPVVGPLINGIPAGRELPGATQIERGSAVQIAR